MVNRPSPVAVRLTAKLRQPFLIICPSVTPKPSRTTCVRALPYTFDQPHPIGKHSKYGEARGFLLIKHRSLFDDIAQLFHAPELAADRLKYISFVNPT